MHKMVHSSKKFDILRFRYLKSRSWFTIPSGPNSKPICERGTTKESIFWVNQTKYFVENYNFMDMPIIPKICTNMLFLRNIPHQKCA